MALAALFDAVLLERQAPHDPRVPQSVGCSIDDAGELVRRVALLARSS